MDKVVVMAEVTLEVEAETRVVTAWVTPAMDRRRLERRHHGLPCYTQFLSARSSGPCGAVTLVLGVGGCPHPHA